MALDQPDLADRAGVDKAYVLHLIEAGTSTNVEMRALELGLNWTPGPA